MLDRILENYSDETILTLDGFDSAVIGIEENSMRLIYSIDRMVEILMNDEELDELDAIDHLEFNVLGGYLGPLTPIFCKTI